MTMRLIRGRNGWWCITRSGTALVRESLVHNGELTDEGVERITAVGLAVLPAPTHYSLTVVTATDCNLGCPYCFQNVGPAGPGSFAPPRIAPAMLREDVIDATVSFAVGRMAELRVPRLEVLLFGGEPLLNAEGCQAVLRRCAERVPTTGHMISNGVLLTAPLAARLASAGLRTVQVTLDGPRATHDTVRTTRAGRGTFDTILANVAAAQHASPLEFTLRVNVTPASLAGIEDLVLHAARVVDPARTRFTVAMVLDYTANADDAAWREEAADQVTRAYALARELGFRLVLPRDAHCDFCSAPDGRTGAVVNADGVLFSCWESVGRPDYAVGTITGGYDDHPPERWISCGAPAGNGSSARRFADAVDAGVLDLARAARRSTPPKPELVTANGKGVT